MSSESKPVLYYVCVWLIVWIVASPSHPEEAEEDGDANEEEEEVSEEVQICMFFWLIFVHFLFYIFLRASYYRYNGVTNLILKVFQNPLISYTSSEFVIIKL